MLVIDWYHYQGDSSASMCIVQHLTLIKASTSKLSHQSPVCTPSPPLPPHEVNFSQIFSYFTFDVPPSTSISSACIRDNSVFCMYEDTIAVQWLVCCCTNLSFANSPLIFDIRPVALLTTKHCFLCLCVPCEQDGHPQHHGGGDVADH